MKIIAIIVIAIIIFILTYHKMCRVFSGVCTPGRGGRDPGCRGMGDRLSTYSIRPA